MHPYSQAVPLAAPVSLYASISHLQSEQVVLPGRDIVLIGQDQHEGIPEILPNVLAGQEVQEAVVPVPAIL